jgi:diguanylate cyclase (GGDEF)-like protein/PAS domain S-box-containing protein
MLAFAQDISAAREAKELLAAAMEALRVSEERYRTVFETSTDAVTINRLEDGRFIDVNPAFLRIFGFEHEEIVGRSSLELQLWTDPLDRKRLVETLQKDSVCRDMEFLLSGKDKKKFWVLISGSLIELDGIPSLLLVIRDISQAKAAAEALRMSEVRYRTIFQTNIDCITISHLSDGEYVEVNQAFLDLIGIEAQEIIGRKSTDLGIWANPEARAEIVEMLGRNPTFRDYQTQFVKKSGELAWVLISASVIELGGVSCIVSVVRDISGIKAAESTIQSLAYYDSLTGLPNRRLLVDRLRQTLTGSARSGHSQALLLIDLDNFKTLNDTLGYQTGDLLLQEVVWRIVACTHEADTVARLVSDEFVVMLEDLSEVAEAAAAQARDVGEKILTSIGQPYLINGHECLSSASIGITVFGDGQSSADDILQQADIAMHQAKGAGRNTVRFFSPALQFAVNARATLEEDLRQGIKSKQFMLYYQPQLKRGSLTGAEALIRWKHPTRGIVPPDEFIPLAEESKLILPLGDWVLETACRQIALWGDRKETASLAVAVNISALQFRLPEFTEQVLAALARTGANPNNLKLELTESMLVENIEDVIIKMAELKSHGLSFSLDDFGTGYSSLAYLKRLPLDQLKIDRAFVRDMLADATSGAIAQAILSLGHAMGLSVMAEGVETEEQRGFLAGIGCNSYQGYLFSRPLPLKEFQTFLKRFAKGSDLFLK